MRSVSVSDYREVRCSDKGLVMCPLISHCSSEGGVDYIPCNTDCAWNNIKSVTDQGALGMFCGDKFIGNYIEKEIK